jgi:hypothetical protein
VYFRTRTGSLVGRQARETKNRFGEDGKSLTVEDEGICLPCGKIVEIS